ncbi:Mov34/MPN/PAD-1 family protein [Kallotenue papyrolyticum]|uniref:Mov34/MPN/PAD-1 family protein n=1 Tax=Kallotenue papyrolyticum TaxID=1325125 RepID=UPI000492D6E9|nr:M67 family metallopeptidase [Kallotenue papyrolyticum]
MLVITPHVRAAIEEQARSSYPEECCGLLIGRIEAERRVALEVWPVVNAWDATVALSADEAAHSKRDRFYIAPGEYLRAQRAAARRDLEIVGCYHSHPDDRAWPSERDRVGASGVGGGPHFSFVIVSVINGQPDAIASATLSSDGARWLAEELRIQEA